MALPDYTSLVAVAGAQGWSTLFNTLLDLLEAQKAVEYAETTLTMNGATETWVDAFPAGVRRLGVTGRVTTVIAGSGGIASFMVGNEGAVDPDMYATGIALAAGTTFADVATADPGGWSATAQDVVVTPDVGAFTSGALKLRAYFIRQTAPSA